MSENRFEFIRKQRIESLNVEIEEYKHRDTGALHYHMAADNDENVFLVALRTVPTDSTGVAHILEHTALCGSQQYPVRDPFFMMTRRSLNTFMNAFTSSDWTAYPFASKNKKDFNNLLDVYLDAVFFANLSELDFAQEGHRVEFENPEDPDTPLTYKGVVFNEMKGAMSSPVSTLWQSFTKYLFPTSTYHFNSGGEPENIVDLSYDQLKAFYNTHYHPSNAIFMTFGDISAAEHQAKFQQQVLAKFDDRKTPAVVAPEMRYNAPLYVEEYYSLDQPGELNDKTHVVMGWLLGECTDLLGMLEAQLLSSVLLENSASPLRKALETTELAKAPSPLCGIEPSNREMSFMCGLEGANSDNAKAIETLIIATLEKVAEEGVDKAQVEAVLHQLELHQREIGGDGYPYGLQLILAGLPAAIHQGDPITLLDLDPALVTLRERIQDSQYIPNLIKTLLLNNKHRITLVMKPDDQLSERKVKTEAARLEKMKSGLSPEQSKHIVALASELKKRQEQVDDGSVLPKVTLQDIPTDLQFPEAIKQSLGQRTLTSFEQGTNGLVYQQYVIDLPELSSEEMAVLPIFASVLSELGAGDCDYLTMQQQQSAVSGGIGAYVKVQGQPDDEQNVSVRLVFSGKALVRNQAELTELMRVTFADVRFDETGRIRELISQKRARLESSITNNGHALAMLAASQGLSAANKVAHGWSGLQGVVNIKALDDAIGASEAEIQSLCQTLKKIHQKLLGAQGQFLWVGDGENRQAGSDSISAWADALAQTNDGHLAIAASNEHVAQVWQTSTDVNFCAQVFKTVPLSHDDAPVLNVLGHYLRNEYLHRTIREQGGAYGGGAAQDSSNAIFKFYSYRDPRIEGTFDDFAASVTWLVDKAESQEALEHAILGVISSLDKPGSPAGEAKKTFHNTLYGRTPELLEAYRAKVLNVSLEDLKRVTQTYLLGQSASKAVVTNREKGQQAFFENWEKLDL